MEWYLVSFLLIVCSSQLCQAARLARNCQSRWNEGTRCQKDGLARAGERDTSFPVPNEGERNRVLNYVDHCFLSAAKCKTSPVASSKTSQDRWDCFNQMRRGLQDQLMQCTKKCIEDFIIPEDLYDPNLDWGYQALLIGNAVRNPGSYCGLGKKKDLQKCVGASGYDFNRKPPNKQPSYVCQVDAECWYNWGSDCQNTWEYQVQPQLCQCSQDMQNKKAVRTAQDQYSNCLKGKGTKMAKDDPVLKWIDTYLRGMCASEQNHQCKGQREATSKRRSG